MQYQSYPEASYFVVVESPEAASLFCSTIPKENILISSENSIL